MSPQPPLDLEPTVLIEKAVSRMNPVLLARRPEVFPALGEVDAAIGPLAEAAGFRVCGVDEAGAGPLAGPVVAAAVVLPPGFTPPAALRDSKLMSERTREDVFSELTDPSSGVVFSVRFGSVSDIDAVGIRPVNLRVMAEAAAEVLGGAGLVLVDAHRPPLGGSYRVFPLVKGDQRSLAVAAASVLAKVSRDRFMSDLDKQFPGYGFGAHKGYGTAGHRAAIRKLGPCPAHRRSFKLT